ncbi:MAG TPA: DUF2269 family protein [Gaiellaceae bacterium]|nr:DUF2269 family protein [Gaiellaceae bacterium]
MYDFLLLVHVLSAFALVGGTVAFWAIALATRPRRPLLSAATVAALVGPTTVVTVAGTLGTLVFGVWLAIYLDAYQLWDAWIVASLVLWLVGTVTGARGGKEYNAAGTAGTPEEVARLWRRGNALAAVSTVAVLTVLVLMIFKPGA